MSFNKTSLNMSNNKRSLPPFRSPGLSPAMSKQRFGTATTFTNPPATPLPSSLITTVPVAPQNNIESSNLAWKSLAPPTQNFWDIFDTIVTKKYVHHDTLSDCVQTVMYSSTLAKEIRSTIG